MTLAAEIEALAAKAVEGTADAGEVRLARANTRRSAAEAIVRQVAVRHAVTVDAIKGNHKSHRKAHVVMARAHSCWLLYEAGYSYPSIATLLDMSHHSLAIRGKKMWADHLAGKNVRVDEATGRRARALMLRYDLTQAQAAERLGVSHMKLKARLDTMRAKDLNHD